LKLIYIIFEDLVPITKKSQHFCSTKIIWLVLFKE
jgi:hypothetical protein